ncbi:anti-sigma factor family protein [Desulfobacter sp.]|uniref:anti-sigma factor family protein n=1 Tax=Desulfobacter sp. TaxID=2294 RepID=UPI003D0E94EC
MKCNAARKRLGPYLDRELNSHSTTELRQHLAVCPDCRHELAALKNIRGELDRLSVPPLPPFLAARIAACAKEQAPLSPMARWLRLFPVQYSRWMAPGALFCGVLIGTIMGLSGPGNLDKVSYLSQIGNSDAKMDYVSSLCCCSSLDQNSIEKVTLALMENELNESL